MTQFRSRDKVDSMYFGFARTCSNTPNDRLAFGEECGLDLSHCQSTRRLVLSHYCVHLSFIHEKPLCYF